MGRGNNNDSFEDDNGHSEDDDDITTRKFVAPADFDGPTQHRHCTDILCFILLVCNWIGMTYVGIYALQKGDYRLILYPLDYNGNVCGTNYGPGDMTNYSKLLYVNSYSGGICVKECPDLTNVTTDGLTDLRTLITYDGIWQPNDGIYSELDKNYIDAGDYRINSTNSFLCNEEDCYPNTNNTALSYISPGIRMGYGYAYYAASTYELFYRCYVTDAAEQRIQELIQQSMQNDTMIGDVLVDVSDTITNNTVTNQVKDGLSNVFDEVYEFYNKVFADIYTSRKYILGFGFGISFIVSLLYIYLMRFPGLLTTVIWGSIGITISLFLVGGYYALKQANEWQEELDSIQNTTTTTSHSNSWVDDRTVTITTYFSYILFSLGGIFLVLGCCLRQSIMDAILCTKEAGRAVNTMTLILLVPVLQTLGFLLFLIPLLYYAINVASMANIIVKDVPALDKIDGPNITVRSYEFDSSTKQLGWYLLFCFFWTANFIVALGDMIIAVSVAKWYFARNKLLVGSWSVLWSIWEVVYYHAGTCAFGSLIIALVQVIRTVIAKAQKHAKETHNKIAQILLGCCQCCFWCMECCLKFVNKNAYIQTAIFSTSFCTSCKASFGLLFRNAGRIGAVSYVSAAVLIVGKLFISTVVTITSYYVIVENLADELHSVAGPVVIIFLISYFISDMFMDVLDMGILTVLHCFIADEEMFTNEGERYTDNQLKNYVDEHGATKK